MSINNMQSKIQQCMFRVCGKYRNVRSPAVCEVVSGVWFSFPFLNIQNGHLASVCPNLVGTSVYL